MTERSSDPKMERIEARQDFVLLDFATNERLKNRFALRARKFTFDAVICIGLTEASRRRSISSSPIFALLITTLLGRHQNWNVHRRSLQFRVAAVARQSAFAPIVHKPFVDGLVVPRVNRLQLLLSFVQWVLSNEKTCFQSSLRSPRIDPGNLPWRGLN